MKIITRTNRLYLREFTLEDAIHFYQMNLDEDVMRHTGDISFSSEVEAREFLLNYKQYQLFGMGRWAVCLKETDEFLGWCGLKLHPDKDHGEPFVEVGYRFYKKHWNNGYATESAKASIDYGFRTLDLKTIFAHAHINNFASHKVLEKCGLQHIENGDYDNMPARLYKIDTPKIEVRRIEALETYPVRHPVLRASRPIEDCEFAGDNLDTTIHLGLYHNNNLIGVATFLKQDNALFDATKQYQLRGMAILKTAQGKGYGALLLQQGETILKAKNNDLIWFNAREVAVPFYKRNNYHVIGKSFEIPSVGTHFVMYKELDKKK